MDLEAIIAQTSYNILMVACVVIAILVVISLRTKHPTEHLKQFLFYSIIAATLIPTFYMIGSTIYLNTNSVSKGPVHWHADMEVWNCGKEVNLQDPVGMLSNKIGTATLHEHNDKRIHLEGVVVHPEDASLGKFFRVIGGQITEDSVVVPTNTGKLPLTSGSVCPDGQEAKLQVFVYQTDTEKYFTQRKLDNPADYKISPYSIVPPGDCIIVEFGPERDRTDKLCVQYKTALKIDKLKGEKP